MGTLRYADRAKKIQNKAVVNESVQDKIIRELKTENDKLKMVLMKAANSGSTMIDLKALGLTDLGLDVAVDENGSQSTKEL